MTQLDPFIQQLEQHINELKITHDSIGTSSDGQQQEVNSLLEDMLRVAHAKVTDAHNTRTSLQQSIVDVRTMTAKLKRLMGQYTTLDDTAAPGTLLDQHAEYTKEYAAVNTEYQKRLQDVQALQQQLLSYSESLETFVRTDIVPNDDIDVSTPTITTLEDELKRCQQEYQARIECVNQQARGIVQLWSILGMMPDNENDSLLYHILEEATEDEKPALYKILVKEDSMRYAERRASQLEEVRQQREFRVHEITHALRRLWDRLKTPQSERDAFIEAHPGYSQPVLDAYENELSRLEVLKKERVQDFVMDARRDLYRLWDKLYFSIAERHAFEPAFQAVFNDQTLEMHEAEIERLKLLAEDRKYILEKVEEHMKLLDEIHEFEEQAKNPARLFNRGGRDPGRLLREEKFRRRVAKQLPKVKKELKGALQEYQIMNGTPFCVNGEPYIHHLDADQSKKANRAFAKTPQSMTVAEAASEGLARGAMTSPRFKQTPRHGFRTPQPVRAIQDKKRRRRQQQRRDELREVDSTPSVFERIREDNLRQQQKRTQQQQQQPPQQQAPKTNLKQKQRARPRMSDNSESSRNSLFSRPSADENTAPSEVGEEETTKVQPQRVVHLKKRQQTHAFSDDENASLSLSIFDDGPELSDMSDPE